MQLKQTLAVLLLVLVFSCNLDASTWPGSVTVEVVADDGKSYPLYPLHNPGTTDVMRSWLEANEGSNYAIRVRNNGSGRIGLVIAVDGRNIISGEKSHLGHGERMYILGPYQQGDFSGWRTSNDRVHRFYFTEPGESYAGAFGDYSAMGVIAIAVYPEKRHLPRISEESSPAPGKAQADAVAGAAEKPAIASGNPALSAQRSRREAGTGFGDEEFSRVRVVRFEPTLAAVEKHFIKYEWRETLCSKRVIDCAPVPGYNRFWPREPGSGRFAPYPPG